SQFKLVKASLKDQAIGAKSVLDAPTLSDSTPQVPLLSSYVSSLGFRRSRPPLRWNPACLHPADPGQLNEEARAVAWFVWTAELNPLDWAQDVTDYRVLIA
ncbi:hypothetical protein, partial [Deinococcus marmoris]|uniref:hypothetical protein n=1 Tax=Deinococcus marmoris TaxID=249408 RepID=UPI0039F0B4CF